MKPKYSRRSRAKASRQIAGGLAVNSVCPFAGPVEAAEDILRVDLPEPEAPTIATISTALMVRLMFFSTRFLFAGQEAAAELFQFE
jgi:hypothetical protein